MAVTIKELLEAGAHFGHRTSCSNPAFEPFLHGERNGINIINSAYTLVQLETSAAFVKEIVAKGGRVIFVATKAQARDIVEEHAERCGQFFITFRWLGGLLTNFKTVRVSIQRMIALEEGEEGAVSLTKKEQLKHRREYDKLHRVLKGVKDMRRAPDVAIIVDVSHESIAVHECNVLGIPIVGIVDSNSNPTIVAHPIPGNDDAVRAIEIYMKELADAAIEGRTLYEENAQKAEEDDTETELALDREEDLDEAALLSRRKVYKVKKTTKSASEVKADTAAAAEAEASVEKAPAEEKAAEAPAKEAAAKAPAKKAAAEAPAKEAAAKAPAKEAVAKETKKEEVEAPVDEGEAKAEPEATEPAAE